MEELTGLDARFLYSETPTAHMHTIKVTVIDVSARTTQLTPERMIEHLAESLERMPILRRRVVPLPFGLGNPGLIDDAHVDVSQHLRHVRAESPGGIRELAEVIAEVTARPLPRDRPLWELTVVDGLEGGQIGFVMKVHHALADGLASVSLLVGGIGIMNILLVSVTERTREIGVRMAVGAKRLHILMQFLIEAVTLSLFGGVIGVIVGIVGARLTTVIAGWPTIISFDAIMTAFVFSLAVGLFFGLYPANKAARLNPIEALRYE